MINLVFVCADGWNGLKELESRSKNPNLRFHPRVKRFRIHRLLLNQPHRYRHLGMTHHRRPFLCSTHTRFFSRRSAVIEEQANIQLVEPNPVKIIEKQTLIEDNPESLLNALLEKDKELTRLLNEKEMLLSRLLNIPQSQMKDVPGHVRQVRHISFPSLDSLLFRLPRDSRTNPIHPWKPLPMLRVAVWISLVVEG